MRVLIAGSSGLIGSALVASYSRDGHTVTRLVRRPSVGSHEASWDPEKGTADLEALAAADVVVNLAGAPIGAGRLTAARARVIKDSRVQATGTIARAMAEVGSGRLIQASAVGFYGNRGEERVDESAAAATTPRAAIVTAWEGAASPAQLAGIPVAFMRTSLVLAHDGALAKKLMPAVRLGRVRQFGSGRQWHSWTTLTDTVAAYRAAAEAPMDGPVNVCAPAPTRDREFFGALAAAAHRRGIYGIPAWALRLVVGDAADELLDSQAVVPRALSNSRFVWTHPTIAEAATWVMNADPPTRPATRNQGSIEE